MKWQVWVLFFIFLFLKLSGAISWSWWWITCPLWGGFFALVLGEVAIRLTESPQEKLARELKEALK
jgi:hypothetical protein